MGSQLPSITLLWVWVCCFRISLFKEKKRDFPPAVIYNQFGLFFYPCFSLQYYKLFPVHTLGTVYCNSCFKLPTYNSGYYLLRYDYKKKLLLLFYKRGGGTNPHYVFAFFLSFSLVLCRSPHFFPSVFSVFFLPPPQ